MERIQMWRCFFKIPSSFPLPPHPALPITSLLSQLNAICSSLALLLSSFSDTLTWPCALGLIFFFKFLFFYALMLIGLKELWHNWGKMAFELSIIGVLFTIKLALRFFFWVFAFDLHFSNRSLPFLPFQLPHCSSTVKLSLLHPRPLLSSALPSITSPPHPAVSQGHMSRGSKHLLLERDFVSGTVLFCARGPSVSRRQYGHVLPGKKVGHEPRGRLGLISFWVSVSKWDSLSVYLCSTVTYERW